MNRYQTKCAVIVTLLLFCIAGAWADVDWTHAGSNRLWQNAANWQDSVTLTARVPGSTDKAAVRQGREGPLIDSTTIAVANVLVIGDWGHTDSVEITGGSLTTGSWIILGYGEVDDGTFRVSGGNTVCNQNLHVGFKGNGRIYMTGGTVTVTGTFGIATSGGSGHVQLDGGTITCNALSMTSGATMDISASGKLVVNGNAAATVNTYIQTGLLTAENGSNTLNVDYNVTTSGKTTVVANMSQKALGPAPNNGAVGVSICPVLTWTPGTNALSHNVYLGTNPNPGTAEFKGNQSAATYDPGALNPNTTYYWRIDEINPQDSESPWPGVVWSFTTQAVSTAGKIVYPWRSTTAIVKAGESFDIWFNAESGQTVNSVELHGPYHKVYPSKSIVIGNWIYDQMSGNRYNTLINVAVPASAPADRYDLVVKTSVGSAISYGGVKVLADYKPDYYIMHISYGHLYQSGYDTNVLLARKSAMIDAANIMDVQIIVETGDNMYNVRNHPERETHYFLGNPQIGTKGMADASAATFLVPGDHDAYIANDWPQATPQENADFFNDYWGRQNYCFKYGSGRFMPFNNAWDVSTSNAKGHQYQIDEAVAWLQSAGSGGNFFVTAGHCYDKMHEFVDDYRSLDLVLAGDKHHVRTDNPWPFDTSSAEVAYIAGSIREHFEFNLFEVNGSTGTFTTPAGTTTVANVLYSGSQDTPSTWVPNLQLAFAKPNKGENSVNSAQILNRYSFPITGARMRFVMPKGSTYGVSAGNIQQQFNGNNFRIVDVNINLNANSTTEITISPEQICLGPADLDCNGSVDTNDLRTLALEWLKPGSSADISQPADDRVDLRDFSILSMQWLQQL